MSRWCWRHVPHNLIAGGGFSAYGGPYDGPRDAPPGYGGYDSGGHPLANHGEIVDSADAGCPDCAALAALEEPPPRREYWCRRCKLVECQCSDAP